MTASALLKAQRYALSVWRPQRVVASKPFTPGHFSLPHTHTAVEVDCSHSENRTLRATEHNHCVCEAAPYSARPDDGHVDGQLVCCLPRPPPPSKNNPQ